MLLSLVLLTILALSVGVLAGLWWRGTVLLGDRRTIDRLSERLLTELRMEAWTQATMRAMRQAAQQHRQGSETNGTA
jgi:hypothetical protein